MCGRFGEEEEYVALARRYQAFVQAPDPGPRYNIAPTQPVAVIVEHEGKRHLTHHRWGLVPAFAKDVSIGTRMINARAETVSSQSAFRESFASRRCIVPATRFYEWKKGGSERVPFSILRNDGRPLHFAGLWSSWKDRSNGERVLSCAIVTTAANETMAPIHDRMPVVLTDDAVAVWLDQTADEATLKSLLIPYPDDEALFAYRVSPLVNRWQNEGPELIVPGVEADHMDLKPSGKPYLG
jgi:putative SOS response-associated peptidase YedK